MQATRNSNTVGLDDLTCPITLDLFHDPVIAGDGHVYEREAISQWIMDNGTSPLTREPLKIEDLRTNEHLRHLARRRRNSTVTYEAHNGIVTLPPIRGSLRNNRPVAPQAPSISTTNDPVAVRKDCCDYSVMIGCCLCFIAVPSLFFGLLFGLSSRESSSSYASWAYTTVHPDVYTVYSDELSPNSTVFTRTGNGSYYYEELQINLTISGDYFFWGYATFNTYSYLYIDSFSTANLSSNLLTENAHVTWSTMSFEIRYHLDSNRTYILIVTTRHPNVTGLFDIYVLGPANVTFY